jgi:hypothetical protein
MALDVANPLFPTWKNLAEQNCFDHKGLDNSDVAYLETILPEPYPLATKIKATLKTKASLAQRQTPPPTKHPRKQPQRTSAMDDSPPVVTAPLKTMDNFFPKGSLSSFSPSP